MISPATALSSDALAGIDPVTDAEPVAPVVASFVASPSQGSAPHEVHFTDTSTGSPTSWRWTFGDGRFSTVQNPVHTYYNVGMYRATLFAERAEPHSAASETREILVLVGDEVTADFTANATSGPAPLTVQFTDDSKNATGWSWTFGDGGAPLVIKNPLWTYQEPGNYTVSLVAESVYRMDTETKVEYISVYGPITASFTVSDRSVQNGTGVQFTSTSTGNPYTFAWDFGDGATSTDRNPTHGYTRAGTYTVSLNATNPLGSVTKTETGYITVYDPVHASFTANNTRGLAPLTVRFTDTSTGNPTSWAWDFGDGGASTERNPLHTYSDPGIFAVTLTASHVYSQQTATHLSCIIAVFGVSQVPDGTGLPTDTNADGLYDDVNGNGIKDFADVVLYFNQMTWISVNERRAAFDYNGNGQIDFADVVWLFNSL